MDGPDETSETLAAQWKPYLAACIAAFGTERCMFASNVPVDRCGATYTALRNAFKRFTQDYSTNEKTALYSGTAQRVYRFNVK
jgi:predicted TIM-barrel fold metal-dependent hydrolase